MAEVSIAAGAVVLTSRCRGTPLVCWPCGIAPGSPNSTLAQSPTATVAGAPVSAPQTQGTYSLVPNVTHRSIETHACTLGESIGLNINTTELMENCCVEVNA